MNEKLITRVLPVPSFGTRMATMTRVALMKARRPFWNTRWRAKLIAWTSSTTPRLIPGRKTRRKEKFSKTS